MSDKPLKVERDLVLSNRIHAKRERGVDHSKRRTSVRNHHNASTPSPRRGTREVQSSPSRLRHGIPFRSPRPRP